MKGKAFLGLLVALLAFSAGGVALGGPKYPTKLSIGYSRSSGGLFAGDLKSHKGCVGGRKVVVYRKKRGHDRAVGNDAAAPNGSWRVAARKPKAGDYYAKTKGSRLKDGAKCAAAKSAATHVS